MELTHGDTLCQGCVAIRGLGGCSGNIRAGANLQKGEFLFGSDYRHFKSFRHFRVSEEEAYRVQMGAEAINTSHVVDFILNYGITDRFFANIALPIAFHHRTSMYEHWGNPTNGLDQRHATSSRGLADLRLGIGYWLIHPEKEHRFNSSLGVGIKLPTGDYNYQDYFYNQGSVRNQTVKAVVDQSIQLGDGGLGITVDLQGYYSVSSSLLLTYSAFYLINPLETNGVSIRNGSNEFSSPDQLLFVQVPFLCPLNNREAFIWVADGKKFPLLI
ncbi:MAG TPA: transporter [Saprospiraceae bacterium]|nr:transporter [Saprospiraceae bacterium]